MHSHSDLQVLVEPDHESRLLQGITTEVLGQDGLSYAPVDDSTLLRLRAQLAGWNGDPPDFHWAWRSVREYLDGLKTRIAVNVAYLVPHGTLRLLAVGDEARAPTGGELQQMRMMLRTAPGDGAVGMSAGLTYVPGAHASTEELVSLCQVVADLGGYFCPHHRNYGSQAFESYRECLDIAGHSGAALHLAHCHVSYPVNAGRVGELLEMLDEATATGLDVTFDSYPYLAGMTSLHVLIAELGPVREHPAATSAPRRSRGSGSGPTRPRCHWD